MQKILVVDDHRLFTECLVRALKKECSGFAFLEAENGEQAKNLLLQNRDCGVLLLDLKVGDEDGLAILGGLRKIVPEIRTLVCTAFYEPLTIESALKMDVQGFIAKTADLKEIVRAVKAVASGNSYFCAAAIEVMKTQFSGACGTASADASMELFSKYKLLSAKEKEVLDLIARRIDVAEIARRRIRKDERPRQA